jgi:tRNA (mo5U34)-methyltransferase
MDSLNLRVQRARGLGPWHFDFEIAPGVRTASLNANSYADSDLNNVQTVDPYHMLPFFKEYYPAGLGGKDVLDAACNSGGYCFVAGQLGARCVTGFDINEHWLTQAQFIKQTLYANLNNVLFEKQDAKLFFDSDRTWDVVIFKGILYHLPDPAHVLLRASKAAREVILIDTVSSNTIPESCWAPLRESATHKMSGVDGLAWLPGGPAALRPLLEYAGFQYFETTYWRHDKSRSGIGRFCVVASRNARQAAPST